jgi:phage terminase small subunit
MNEGFELLSLNWINYSDFYSLLLRLFLNVFFLTIIIRFLYYPKTKRKDVLRMQLLRFLAEFGMTPTARKQVVGIKPEKVNPWAKFAAPAQKKA